jgi:uncharacterized DUF497 family protein
MSIRHNLESLEFEWDANKAESNFLKHGVTFEEASEVFLDSFYVMGMLQLMKKIENSFLAIRL